MISLCKLSKTSKRDTFFVNSSSVFGPVKIIANVMREIPIFPLKFAAPVLMATGLGFLKGDYIASVNNIDAVSCYINIMLLLQCYVRSAFLFSCFVVVVVKSIPCRFYLNVSYCKAILRTRSISSLENPRFRKNELDSQNSLLLLYLTLQA